MKLPVLKKLYILMLLFCIPAALRAEDIITYQGVGNIDFPPYEYLDEYGRPAGFNIDVINAIEEKTGLNIAINLMPQEDALSMFSTGQADFMTGAFFSRMNTGFILEKESIIMIPFAAIFRKDFDRNSLRKPGLQISYNSSCSIETEILNSFSGALTAGHSSDLSAVTSVIEGKSGCAVLSRYSAWYLFEHHITSGVMMLEKPLFSMEYAPVFTPGNRKLLEKFSEGLAIIKGNGEYSSLYSKWFKKSGRSLPEKYTFILLSILIALLFISVLIILFYILLRREVKNRTTALHKEISQNYYIADLSRKVLSDVSIENITRTIMEYLADLTGSTTGITGYLNNEAVENYSIFAYTRHGENVMFSRLDTTQETAVSIKEKIFSNRDSFYSNDPSDILLMTERPENHMAVNNVLCSPSTIGEKVVGFLIMGNSPKNYDDEDLNIVENFSSQYALAIQRMWFEHDLIRSEKKYRDIFNNVEDLLYLYDLEGNFIEVNNAFVKVFGYNMEELQKWNIVTILSGSDDSIYNQQDVVNILNRVLSEGSINGEVKIKSKSGKSVIIEYKNTLILDDDGRPSCVQGSARDITERKIFEKMLIEAREKARESDSLKTNFLANMSHEIRTPLNAVLGFTEILIEEVTNPAHENYLRMIQKSGSLLLSIIDEILDLSKIESGSLKIIEAPFNLNSMLKNLYNNAFVLVRSSKKPIEVDYDCDPAIAKMLTGDESRIEQVMNNLISNAVKFTESGRIDFGVRLMPGNMLEFFVEDSGIGISFDNIPLVFERFRQVDYGNKRSYGGTGLGLSISRMIVEMMGGTINVESEPGRGSKFIFTLPYLPAMENADTAKVSDITPKSVKTVMVVEDNSINRLLVAKVLEKNGFVCIMAVDGFEAVETYKSGRHIDAILMDIQMPRMDGLEALTIIRGIEQDGGKGHIPIIALSAHVMKDDVQKFLEAGFDSYIGKPFNREDLIRGIMELTEI